jgi:glucosamine--fructose-6-phosphate aminotransferase (isomerizing)
MCGIIALLSKSTDVRKKLLDGLKMLQNRGYDSCGGVLLDPNYPVWYWKKASSGCSSNNQELMHDAMGMLQDVIAKTDLSQVYRGGFFQTRWATHGAKTDANAHPHFDGTKRFFVVHNGIISNYNRLKDRLKLKGYVFTSETDTEVVPHLIMDCLVSLQTGRGPQQPTLKSASMFQVWQMVVGELEGTWSLIMCDVEHPERLYVAKNGSPLLMAFSDDNTDLWFASERSGFELYTRKYIIDVPDKTVLECRRGLRDQWVINTSSAPFSKCLQAYLAPLDENTEIKDREMVDTMFLPESFQVLKPTPHPYHYWTELEISEQPDKLWEALNCGGRLYRQDDHWRVKLGGLDLHRERLKKVRHLILTGCGTSYHACLFASPVFRQLSGLVTVQCVDASEFVLKDLPQDSPESIALVIVSQSGETKDCQRVIQAVSEFGIMTIGIVNTVGSWIARESSCGIYLNAGREVGVASTKSFTSQCMVLSLLALWWGQENGKDLGKWPVMLSSVSLLFKNHMYDLLHEFIPTILPLVENQSNMFLLGRGFSHAVCLEGALKLKELTYQNAEGYPGGALKHGPFALIDGQAQTPVFLHLWKGPNYTVMLSALEQVVSRGAQAIVLHNNTVERKQLTEKFPKVLFYCLADCTDEWSASLVSVLVYQLLAVQLCLKKGLNPDYPRNLAKVVSVDG